MGKRELLLLVVFVVLGIGVYQVSAPAAPADAPGFSLSRIFQMARAHFSGPTIRRTVTRRASVTPSADVTTLDFGETRASVVVEGGDGDDIEVELEAMVAAMDEADAARQERQLTVTLEEDGDRVVAGVRSDDHMRPPRYEMRVTLPRRLAVRIGGRGSAEIRDVAGLHLQAYRGDLTAERIAGPVTGELRDSGAEFGPGATVNLTADRGRLRLDAPASVTLDAERATVDIIDPTGPITFTQQQCRSDIRGTGGPVKVTGEGGTIVLRQVSHPLTIEAERLTVTAELVAAVPTMIGIERDEVEVTLPKNSGVALDATVTNGDLRLPQGLAVTDTDGRKTFAGPVAGGGPLVKLTLDQGSLRIR
ncbi:MAG: hypothetical protein IT182_08475 [Acidobacteria bacterium]|nr:hypothetical protein [Acidobacteriota bacterium]